MLSYGLFFALAGFVVRDLARARGWRRLVAVGVVVPVFAMAAAIFDASENLALLLALAGNGGGSAPLFAAVCSAIKFTLITIAILYSVWPRTLVEGTPPAAKPSRVSLWSAGPRCQRINTSK
jgi:hypothetical protein